MSRDPDRAAEPESRADQRLPARPDRPADIGRRKRTAIGAASPLANTAAPLDAATGWPRFSTGQLTGPPSFALIPSPTKCPAPNPQENVRRSMRENWQLNR